MRVCVRQYCGSPPLLRVCDREEAAYTAAFLFHKATFSMTEQRHILHCYCPPPFTHVHSDVEEDVQGTEMVMATIYSCSRVSLWPLSRPFSPCIAVLYPRCLLSSTPHPVSSNLRCVHDTHFTAHIFFPFSPSFFVSFLPSPISGHTRPLHFFPHSFFFFFLIILFPHTGWSLRTEVTQRGTRVITYKSFTSLL